MQVDCPTCQQRVELNGPPIRGNASDGSEAWTCIRCPAVVCVDCYHDHVRTTHPEMLKERKKR